MTAKGLMRTCELCIARRWLWCERWNAFLAELCAYAHCWCGRCGCAGGVGRRLWQKDCQTCATIDACIHATDVVVADVNLHVTSVREACVRMPKLIWGFGLVCPPSCY